MIPVFKKSHRCRIDDQYGTDDRYGMGDQYGILLSEFAFCVFLLGTRVYIYIYIYTYAPTP